MSSKLDGLAILTVPILLAPLNAELLLTDAYAYEHPPANVELAHYAMLAAEFLKSIHLRGKLMPLLREATIERLLLQYASDATLIVTDSELQVAADAFRKKNDLCSVNDMNTWLERKHLTIANFEDALKQDLLTSKLLDYLTKGRIAQNFDANPTRYDRVYLKQIVLGNEDFANTLVKKIRKQVNNFSQFAREYSLDRSSAINGGDLGLVFRHQLPQKISEVVFSAQPGDVVGSLADSSSFYLFLVETMEPAELDDFTVESIQRELFDAWLSEQFRDLRIDPQLLKLL